MSKEKMRHYTELFTSLDFMNKGKLNNSIRNNHAWTTFSSSKINAH
jgi:hypothetical protein